MNIILSYAMVYQHFYTCFILKKTFKKLCLGVMTWGVIIVKDFSKKNWTERRQNGPEARKQHAVMLLLATASNLLATASNWLPLARHCELVASWLRVTCFLGSLLAITSNLLAVASYDSPDLQKWCFWPENLNSKWPKA
jgi:hypothetical protein